MDFWIWREGVAKGKRVWWEVLFVSSYFISWPQNPFFSKASTQGEVESYKTPITNCE
jgi:hypothetical protein